MRIIYSIGISIYGLGIRVASLFAEKPRQMVKGWRETFSKIEHNIPSHAHTAWFHASSMGEFEQARPVLEKFKTLHPDYKIVVSFFSPSGYEIRKNYPLADVICYLPIDTPANARRLVRAINPQVTFFVKYDYWFNCLSELHKRKVPTYIFSAIFRPNQYFFKWYGNWFCKQLGQCFTHLFVQNEDSVMLLKQHGISQCSIAGDTRFDRVHAIAQDAQRFPTIEEWIAEQNNRPVLIAGSSWEPDETFLKQYLDKHGNLSLILAPHVISESHIRSIEDLFGKSNCVRYTQLDTLNKKASILIIDTMGMLSAMYRYGTVAYIGGGFGKGIHNILEAVTFGLPVIFGPNYQKFQEARDIISRGGGKSFVSYEQLSEALDPLLQNPEFRKKTSAICTAYLNENLGSSDTILNHLSL